MSAASHAAASSARLERLRAALAERSLDALIVTPLVDVRYLTGYTGSNGLALVFDGRLAEQLGRPRFLTDFRYEAQSAAQVPGAFERTIAKGELLDAVAAELGAAKGRIGFDEDAVTVRGHRSLQESLGQPWELVPVRGLMSGIRAVKEAGEISALRAASELADEALKQTLEGGLAGRTEIQVSDELQRRMKSLGAQAPSFPPIVASGENGALPHAEPTDRTIARDVLVTIDWGAVLDDYCSDCTRTYATGEGISEHAREIYELVLRAQLAGVDAALPGRSGREVDAAARAVIEQAGHGEHFGHGLGHGVGLEVHEAPRLSRLASEEPLVAGNVVTVEPGVYLPGELGVRIEDLLVLTGDSHEILTALAKELTVIG